MAHCGFSHPVCSRKLLISCIRRWHRRRQGRESDAAMDSSRPQVVNLAVEGFERRLVEEIAGVRVEMARSEGRLREDIAKQGAALQTEIVQQAAAVRQEIARDRFELMKWSFLFWVGQVFAVVGLVGVMLRAIGPVR